MRTALLNVIIEFGPASLFLAVYYIYDFFAAVAASAVATVVAVSFGLWIQRRIAWFPIISLASNLLFSGATLLLREEDLFIFQDTVGNFLFAAVLLWTAYYRTPLLKFFFSHVFALSERGWFILTERWGLFFFMFGIGNEVMRLAAAPDMWVWFKAFSMVATVVFGCYQFRVAMRERIVMESNWLGLRTSPLRR